MDKYLIKKRLIEEQPSIGPKPTFTRGEGSILHVASPKKICIDIEIISDPGLRPSIGSCLVNNRDRVRRAYLQKGSTQVKGHDYPYAMFGNRKHRFNVVWYNEFEEWLEYSVEKDVALCLFCYIFPEVGLVHVNDTRASSLRNAISNLLCSYGLSITNLRGQGYDGASNMRGEFNGLKTLILKENPSAFYIHYFAHQLQLILVAVAQNHLRVVAFFDIILMIMNCASSSCKCRDALRTYEVERVTKELECGDIKSGKGQNQEFGVKRVGDTRWSSHYGGLVNLTHMFSSIVGVLKMQILKEKQLLI